TSAAFVADLSSSIASLPGAEWAGLGLADLSAATAPSAGGRQLGVEAIFAGTTRTGAGPTAAAHAVGELRWSAATWGAGIAAGPSRGPCALPLAPPPAPRRRPAAGPRRAGVAWGLAGRAVRDAGRGLGREGGRGECLAAGGAAPGGRRCQSGEQTSALRSFR